MTKTAAILIVGNEILSGSVTDSNANYFTRMLWELGVDVRRIVTLPDEVDRIAEEIAFCRSRFDWIFTSGGIGPTHDDVTMAGLAKGLSVPLARHPDIVRLLSQRHGSALNPAHLKMADLPEGTHLIALENRLPILHFENIYIFPGVPEHLIRKFEAIQERFREPPFHVGKIFLRIEEEAIAETLNLTVDAFPALRLGSYPHPERSDYSVSLTLESKAPEALRAAMEFLLVRLPQEAIVRVVEDG
jgi:molybdenum cofactor synthesis domain-containing protein